jgi:hypothetical protein
MSKPTIGSAAMDPDGTIVLSLVADDGAGTIGHAMLRYPPDHGQYAEILEHLGGLEPGDSKPVPPWD